MAIASHPQRIIRSPFFSLQGAWSFAAAALNLAIWQAPSTASGLGDAEFRSRRHPLHPELSEGEEKEKEKEEKKEKEKEKEKKEEEKEKDEEEVEEKEEDEKKEKKENNSDKI